MFTLDTYVLVKCTHFIVWISDGHRGYSLRPISPCFHLALKVGVGFCSHWYCGPIFTFWYLWYKDLIMRMSCIGY